MEEWKSFEINGKIYQGSTLGRIKNPKGRILKGTCSKIGTDGYIKVLLCDGKKHSVHRIIATLFIPNPENKPQVDHINGDRTLNAVSNLRWATNQENQLNEHAREKQRQRTGEKAAHWNKPHTENSKQLISKNRKGKDMGHKPYFIPSEEKKQEFREEYGQKVSQYSLSGEYIETYNSYAEASICLKGNRNHTSSISRCCRGERNTAIGYKWQNA